MIRLLILAMMLPAHALAAGVAEAQKSSFHSFYRATFPDDHAAQPVFSAAGAHVDSTPRRGLRTLCRMTRTRFSFDKQWSVMPQRTEFVWLQKGACSAPARAPVLLGRMPDTELISVLEQPPTVLARARLLMAGNSACARARSFNFALASIGVGTSGKEAEEMVALGYASDRSSAVTIWIRRSGAEYDAWNVACPAAK